MRFPGVLESNLINKHTILKDQFSQINFQKCYLLPLCVCVCLIGFVLFQVEELVCTHQINLQMD